jgi:succinate dehydrogenase / fumarate reductase flavoprotein subunit
MLQLARVIAQGAGMRDESRGAHYKPDFPERDDKNWLKTTKATFAPDADEPKFEFEPVDVSLIPPRARRYDAVK